MSAPKSCCNYDVNRSPWYYSEQLWIITASVTPHYVFRFVSQPVIITSDTICGIIQTKISKALYFHIKLLYIFILSCLIFFISRCWKKQLIHLILVQFDFASWWEWEWASHNCFVFIALSIRYSLYKIIKSGTTWFCNLYSNSRKKCTIDCIILQIKIYKLHHAPFSILQNIFQKKKVIEFDLMAIGILSYLCKRCLISDPSWIIF